MKVTGSDRETARFFVGALRGHLVGLDGNGPTALSSAEEEKALVEGVARTFAFLRDQIVSCAVVQAEKERTGEQASKPAGRQASKSEGARKPLRRRLRKEVSEVFETAIEMCGGTYHPDKMDDEKARLRRLRVEVLEALGSVVKERGVSSC